MTTDKNQPIESRIKSAYKFAKDWGRHPGSAFAAGTLIGCVHFPPLGLYPRQLIPLIFPPMFYTSTYLNMAGDKHDAAALNCAYSALYLVLTRRSDYNHNWAERRTFQRVCKRMAVPLCLMNMIGGGLVFSTEERTVERDQLGDLVREMKSWFK